METVCGRCFATCDWSTLKSGWGIIYDSHYSVNQVLLIKFGIRDSSSSSWLGVYSGGFPYVLRNRLGNSATIKTFNTCNQIKFQ